jgi:hypothetical protein
MMAMSKVNLRSFLMSKLQGSKVVKYQVEEEVYCELDKRYTACHLIFFSALLSNVCSAIEPFI